MHPHLCQALAHTHAHELERAARARRLAHEAAPRLGHWLSWVKAFRPMVAGGSLRPASLGL
jgi:hypothetical protein